MLQSRGVTHSVANAYTKYNMLDFVSQCRERLHHASFLAKEALSLSQRGMKKLFDREAVERRLQPRDQVSVLLPVPGSALAACFSGPYSM